MGRFKTFTNFGGGGDELLPTDLNLIQDDYDLAFSTYKLLGKVGGTLQSGAGTSLMVLNPTYPQFSAGTSPVSVSGLIPYEDSWYDAPGPADEPRVTQLALRVYAIVNGVGTGRAIQFAVREASVTNGTSGNPSTLAATGTNLSGNLIVPDTSLVANAIVPAFYDDFDAPTGGDTALLVCVNAIAGAIAANSRVDIVAELHMRQA